MEEPTTNQTPSPEEPTKSQPETATPSPEASDTPPSEGKGSKKGWIIAIVVIVILIILGIVIF